MSATECNFCCERAGSFRTDSDWYLCDVCAVVIDFDRDAFEQVFA